MDFPHILIGIFADSEPRMDQHPRLHAMSVWLHLIPRLHTAGANNIFPAHNAFTGHDDPSLFTGIVRPSSFSHGYQVLFNSTGQQKKLPTSYSAHFLITLLSR